MSEYTKFKEIQKLNFKNRDTTKKCIDCNGELQPHWYGYSCMECGQMFNFKLEYIKKAEDLI